MQHKTLLAWFIVIFTIELLCSVLQSHCLADEPQPNFKRWQKTIAAFEQQDRQSPFPKNGLLFVGSSSIRLWDLQKHFPQQKPLNRGFGGSEIADSVHYRNQLILKHAPADIVLYAGDNDVSRGKSAEQVAEDFRQFVTKIHQKLPEAGIHYVCIKPSIARWKLAKTIKQANEKIHSQCKKHKLLHYVDVWKPMLNEQGEPRAELFRKDGLHLNEQGYALWTSLVKQSLQTAKK